MVNRLQHYSKKVALVAISLPATASVAVGAKLVLTATLNPTNANELSTTWDATAPRASLIKLTTTTAEVTGLQAGTSIVTVTDEYTGLSAQCRVTVTAT